MTLKRSRSSTSAATVCPLVRARSSARPRRSSASARFASPVSGSCSAAWRLTCSEVSRSTALEMTLATATMKLTSSGVNARRRREWAASTPNAASRPSIGTVTPLTTLSSTTCRERAKRGSTARSSTTTGFPVASARPACRPGSFGVVVRRMTPWSHPEPATSVSSDMSELACSTAAYSTSSVAHTVVATSTSTRPISVSRRANWPSRATACCLRARASSSCSCSRRSVTSSTWLKKYSGSPSSPRTSEALTLADTIEPSGRR